MSRMGIVAGGLLTGWFERINLYIAAVSGSDGTHSSGLQKLNLVEKKQRARSSINQKLMNGEHLLQDRYIDQFQLIY